MKIYTAGPLGFSEAGRVFHTDVVVRILRDLKHDVLDPWTLTDRAKIEAVANLPYGEERRDAWRALNVEIGANNCSAIDRCDLVFVVLDGVDVDSGSAAEVGYAFAKCKVILGYRGDLRLAADNEGAVINLQVEYFIRRSGGDIITRISELPGALRRIAARLASGATGEYQI